jgi:glycine cleavage system aminomethyltransferase T
VAMELDRDFREFVESFIAHDVRFLIVGGYALAAHGVPRATGDLDAWVWIDPANAKRIVDALASFGFKDIGVTESDFTRADSVIQLGYAPYRIDILTSIDGVDFESAWIRRASVDVGGVVVGFIGRDDLITNKRAVGRPQDLVDVERLLEN